MRLRQTRWFLPVVAGIAVCTIIWRVGFYTPGQELPTKRPGVSRSLPGIRTVAAAESESTPDSTKAQPAGPSDTEGDKPTAAPDSNEEPAPAEIATAAQPEAAKKKQKPNKVVAEPNTSDTDQSEGEAVNLKNVEMRLIIQKIADWTGKVVIPTDEIMKEKITIYAPGRLTRTEALEQIYGALRMKGYAAEEADKTIYLKPIRDARIGTVPMISADQPLAAIENKEQIVQKFFKLTNFDPSQMVQIVQPLMGEYGYLNADEPTSSLFAIDTVRNLMRIEAIIAQFDVPEAQQLTTEVFEVRNRPPDEIVQLLQVLLGPGPGQGPDGLRTVLSVSNSSNNSRRRGRGPTTSSSVVIHGAHGPLMLVAESSFNWIIAKASAEDMKEIRTWLERIDQPVPTVTAGESLDKIENKTQIVQRFVKLEHCSADRMTEILTPLLGPSGHIIPEPSTDTLLIVDSVENQQRAEEIIAQFDVPPREDLVTQIFELRYREPEEISGLLSVVLGDGTGSSGNSFGRGRTNWSVRALRADRSRYRNGRPSNAGTEEQPAVFIPEPQRKWIIVKARPEDIKSIATWIEKLDKPIPTVAADDSLDKIEDKTQVVQRFLRLQHCSVDRMMAIIGPMLGDVARITPESNTGTLLIVDTVENLQRIEKIVAQFDVPQRDDTVTQVFELQYREPEEIANLLGTVVREGSTSGFEQSRGRNSDWVSRAMRLARFRSGGSNRSAGVPVVAGSSEQPVLFIPEPHRKWIIVKARQEDMDLISGWIKRLDRPTPTVTADQPLSQFQSKNQVVQEFVKLKHYDPVRMSEIVTPLLTEAGHVTAEEGTATLLLIDTVENLMRIEAVIAQFDTAEADTATEIFEVRQRTPEEVISLLETVLSDNDAAMGNTGYGNRNSQYYRSRRSNNPRTRFTGSTGSADSTVILGAGGRTISLVPEPKQGWIIAKASPDDIAQIRKWVERLDRPVETITADTPLSTIENKNQVVQRCIKLHSYSASRMAEIVLPLLSESGYVSADEATGNLLLIDTVENLIHIESIVAQFDVPGAEQAATQVFEMAHADPAEVVQLLRMMLSDTPTRPGNYGNYRGRSYPGSRGYSSSSNRFYRGGMSGSAANSTIMGPSQLPIVLIPEPNRKWVIARASAEDMKLITEWIQKLDQGEPAAKEYETVPITYADVREVATRINEALQQMPGTELQASVLVQALEQARQVMVFGRQDLREMVKKMIEEIDVPPGQFETKHFQLQHADPDQIKRNIDDLFGEGAMLSRTASYRSYGGYGSRSSAAGPSPDTVKTISHVALKQITVIASPENMKKIAEQIEQWDVPIDVNEVRPRIVELRNSDPSQMATLLKTLFSQEMSSRYSFFDYLFGSSSQDKQRIVGPLYGQLTFEEVPGSKKIVVISNVPGAYDVVEQLIKELDSREAAEVPKVVRLNYADPESLAERLNAMFNETGTSASISLTQHGLSQYSMDESSSSSGGNNNARNAANTNTVYNQAPAGEYRPWWTTGRGSATQTPISNMIGRVRFIPDTHSRSILVLTPPEFVESLEQMITELDVPGKQLMLKAIIMQVDHQNMTSLGVQYSSDAAKWQTMDNENALVARNTLAALEQHGSLVIDPQTGALSGTGSLLQGTVNVNVLVDFLMRELHAKILNQQTLWTKDNEEAQFFKGQRVGFQTEISISDTGGRATSQYTYEKVGMTLRARPSITPEKNVDMIINVILSQLESEIINSQPVRTELDTTTNMVVQDGQTILLGGMLFQEDSRTKRKIPLLGDLPLVGGLFRHKQGTQANSELLIFVTPYVIETSNQMLPEARQELKQAQKKLKDVQRDLKPLAGQDDPLVDSNSPEPPAAVAAPDDTPVPGEGAKKAEP